MAVPDASVVKVNCHVWSGWANTGGIVRAVLSLLKAI